MQDDPLALQMACQGKPEAGGRHKGLHPDFVDEPISMLQLCAVLDAVHCLEVSKLSCRTKMPRTWRRITVLRSFQVLLEYSEDVDVTTADGSSLLHLCGRYNSHRTAQVHQNPLIPETSE